MSAKTKMIPSNAARSRSRSGSSKNHEVQASSLASFVELSHLPSPPANVYVALLGMEPRPVSELVEAVKVGLSYQAFAHFQHTVQLPAKDVASLLKIPNSTLVRRKERGRLDSSESERLLRFSRLFAAAVELFEGDAPAARRWLQTPAQALNRVTPWEMARTELGAREVEKLIERLEDGVYS